MLHYLRSMCPTLLSSACRGYLILLSSVNCALCCSYGRVQAIPVGEREPVWGAPVTAAGWLCGRYAIPGLPKAYGKPINNSLSRRVRDCGRGTCGCHHVGSALRVGSKCVELAVIHECTIVFSPA
jgi:hypothetical protein